MHLPQRRRDAERDAQKFRQRVLATNLIGQQLDARILTEQSRATLVLDELERAGSPSRLQLVSQRVRALQASHARRRELGRAWRHDQHRRLFFARGPRQHELAVVPQLHHFERR